MNAKDLTKEYTNGEVTIVWKNSLCKHAAECVKNNPDVFKPKEKPWIDAKKSTTDKIIETVKKCPSGALTYYLNNETKKKINLNELVEKLKKAFLTNIIDKKYSSLFRLYK